MSTGEKEKGGLVVVDAFSGPGGLSLGFRQAGFTVAVGLEHDPRAAETYRMNFPEAEVIEKDVAETTGDELLQILDKKYPKRSKTILVGGPPCQPFSKANMHQNKGENHPSASAVDEFWKLLKEVSPDAFLFENVVTFERIGGTGSMVSLIDAMKGVGFSVTVTKLDAQAFQVPQHRRRLFIGGVKRANRFALPSSNSANALSGPSFGKVEPIDVREAISDLPALSRGGGGVDARDYPSANGKELCPYQKWARKGSSILFNHWSSRHSEGVLRTISCIRPGLSLTRAWDSLPLEVRERYGKHETIQSNIYYRLSWKKTAPTIVHPRRAMLLHPRQNRILSVREAARLQSFPDTFRFCGLLDSQYQQVANAVPPLLARSLAETYMDYLLNIP